jgi:hypothetical protein
MGLGDPLVHDRAVRLRLMFRRRTTTCIGSHLKRRAPPRVRNTAGIRTIDKGVNGGTVTSFDDWSSACEKVLTKNGNPAATIFAPRTYGVLDRLKEATTNAPLAPPASYAGLAKYVTSQLPITNVKGGSNVASEAYVGDFAQLLIDSRTDLVLEITRVLSLCWARRH